jgi:hypothetical protein
MRDARFTPGPWWGDGCGAVMAGEPGAARAVAEVYGVDGDPETLQANERLIAAAPTLVQSLRELVDAVHDGEPATIKRAMRAAVALLVDVEGGACG